MDSEEARANETQDRETGLISDSIFQIRFTQRGLSSPRLGWWRRRAKSVENGEYRCRKLFLIDLYYKTIEKMI